MQCSCAAHGVVVRYVPNTACSGRPWPAAFWPVWVVRAMDAAEAYVGCLRASQVVYAFLIPD